MKEQLEKFKKEKLFKLLKFLGALFVLVVLFNIYSSFFLKKSHSSLVGNGTSKESITGISGGDGFFGAVNSPNIKRGTVENNALDSVASTELRELAVGDDMQVSQVDKKIIKNGFLTLKVESTDGATEEITKIITENDGEIFSSNFNEYVRGSRSGTITVKVPAPNFQKTITELKTVATQVVNESTSGQDVTEQYVDLQAQLKNKKAEEQTFVSLLDRSGELNDVLSVSREIARVRGEIERLEGKVKYLESQTDMSTITVNLSEDIEVTPISDDWRPTQVVKKALNDLKVASQDFVNAMIHFFIVTIPSLIPFAIFLFIAYWIGKKIYLKVSKK